MQTQKNTTEPQSKARSIYDIHAESDSFITVAKAYPRLKREGERHWFQHHEKGEDEFKKKIAESNGIKTDYNSYFSVNSFSRPQRSNATLYRLNALYADIDWHGKQVDYRAVLEVLENNFFGSKIPYPTHVNHTGRGLQIFWQINHAPRHALKFWMMVEHLIVSDLECITEYLPGVEVDKSCVTVDQVMRQPNSWHVTAKTFAEELELDYLHPQQYTLSEIADGYYMDLWDLFDKNHAKKLEKEKRYAAYLKNKSEREAYKAKRRTEKAEFKQRVTKVFNGYTLMLARLDDFKTLLELRDYDIKGMRDTFYFFYAWTFATEHTTVEKITSELLGLNCLLKNPLPDQEVEAKAKEVFERLPRVKPKLFSQNSTDELAKLQKTETGKVFKGFKNTTMITRLKITRDEMKYMKTIIDKREKYDRNNAKRRVLRRDENGLLEDEKRVLSLEEQIIKMKAEKNKNKDIATQLGINIKTVEKYITKLRKSGRL